MLLVFVFIGSSRAAFNQPTKNMLIEVKYCTNTPTLSYLQSVENLPTVFGSNSKAQTAAKAVFDLAHRHGNILREGWKNIMESMLQLFRSELLPKAMVEVSVPQVAFHAVSDQIRPAAIVHVSMLCWAFIWVRLPPAVL